jgi:hypothetical protein
MMTGSVFGSLDLDPGPGDAIWNTGFNWDAYLVAFEADGRLGWAYAFGGPGYECGRDIAVDAQGRVLLAFSEPGPASGRDTVWNDFFSTSDDRDGALLVLPAEGP